MMEYVVPFEALAELLHDHLGLVYGDKRPWEQMPQPVKRDVHDAVRRAMVEADARGLLRLFPDDEEQSLIG
jgi:hypothetical protein